MPSTRNALTAGLLCIAGLFLTTIACVSLFGAVPSVAPTPAPPTFTPAPTNTAVPLYQQVALNSTSWEEQGQSPSYTITAQTAVLVGSDDPRVQAFNSATKGVVDHAVAAFKKNLADLLPTPNSTTSTLQIRSNLLSPPGNIFSIKFDMQSFYSGAVHPGDTSQTVNFDLERGQALALGDLFTANADYLAEIAKYCVAQLTSRDIGFQGFELGATPTEQNYRNWNITSGGLMITFDEYQVAAYAAGPQTVVIPFGVLAPLIRPDGPLAQYVK
jgi:hypothetical protein